MNINPFKNTIYYASFTTEVLNQTKVKWFSEIKESLSCSAFQVSPLPPEISWKEFEISTKGNITKWYQGRPKYIGSHIEVSLQWISLQRHTAFTIWGGYEVPICKALHHCLRALLPYAKTLISKRGIWKNTLSWHAKHMVRANVIWIPTQISEHDPERQSQRNVQVLGETHIHLSSFKFSLLERTTTILPLTDSHGKCSCIASV